jgi:hypothetical protein
MLGPRSRGAISALLGKGGMGEVSRGADTKLKREVAIKILPEEFSRDHDLRVGECVKMTGIAEIFNVYSHQEFTYNTLETSAAFGARTGTAGPPRTAQLAFRVSF